MSLEHLEKYSSPVLRIAMSLVFLYFGYRQIIDPVSWTGFVALILSLHLFGIAFSIGLNELGIRDFGLAFATLAVFFRGADSWCLDRKRKK